MPQRALTIDGKGDIAPIPPDLAAYKEWLNKPKLKEVATLGKDVRDAIHGTIYGLRAAIAAALTERDLMIPKDPEIVLTTRNMRIVGSRDGQPTEEGGEIRYVTMREGLLYLGKFSILKPTEMKSTRSGVIAGYAQKVPLSDRANRRKFEYEGNLEFFPFPSQIPNSKMQFAVPGEDPLFDALTAAHVNETDENLTPLSAQALKPIRTRLANLQDSLMQGIERQRSPLRLGRMETSMEKPEDHYPDRTEITHLMFRKAADTDRTEIKVVWYY